MGDDGELSGEESDFEMHSAVKSILPEDEVTYAIKNLRRTLTAGKSVTEICNRMFEFRYRFVTGVRTERNTLVRQTIPFISLTRKT